jgi:hypothetical protein
MNDCNAMQIKFTEYLDGLLSGREMQSVAAHLEQCRTCAEDWKVSGKDAGIAGIAGSRCLSRKTCCCAFAWPSATSGPAAPDTFHAMNLAWRNTVGPFLLQAAAGFASAVLLLGTVIVLVSMFARPESAQATADEPLGMATAPRFLYLSSVVGGNPIGDVSSSCCHRGLCQPPGQVYDYRIVSGPTDRPPARRSRICSCGAASSRHGASGSLSPAWRFSPSPASQFADNIR